ncbi:MAG: ATP-binding cassette domain-containing protein [Polyangiaceae bacterium]
MIASEPILRAEGIVVGGGRVLDGASIELHDGEIATLTGPSGSGKSTLLRVLGLLVTPDAGSLRLRGVDARDVPPEVFRRRVGFVAQSPAMLEGTVADNLRRGPSLAKRPIDDAAVRALLDRVGLPRGFESRVARETSGGERVRVAIARALSLEPEALLLDEPTASLDRGAAARILELVEALASTGRAVLVVTHAAEDVARLGGVAWACAGGRVTRARTPPGDARAESIEGAP